MHCKSRYGVVADRPAVEKALLALPGDTPSADDGLWAITLGVSALTSYRENIALPGELRNSLAGNMGGLSRGAQYTCTGVGFA
jgi:hypothetical protein